MARRIVLLTVLLLSLASGCAGAGHGEEVAKEKTQEAAGADTGVTLEVYGWQDEYEDISLLADAYEEKHPQIAIHINIIPVTEYAQQMRILKNREEQVDCIFNPNAPDAVVMKNKGLLKDISSQIETAGMDAQYGEWYQTEEGCRSYMLPYRMSRWCVYYNKKLFDRMGVPYPWEGWTWEDYEKTAIRLTGTVDGVRTYGSLSFEPGNIWWRVPARTAGANNPLVEAELEEFKKAAGWCYRLTYDLGVQMPYSDRIGSSGYDYEGAFLNGNIGMYYCGDWSIAVLNRAIREAYPDFEYDVAPMPRWEGKDCYVINDAAVVSVAEASKHPQEAFDFAQFCAGPEGAAVLAASSILPAWNSQEIRDIFSQATAMPEHTEYFFGQGKISSVPADAKYDEAMEIVKDEVTLYLLKEQELEQTFENIREGLASLEQEQP